MAEAFSYFTYNNNLERSFLSSLSQILQESNEHDEHDTSSRLEILEDEDELVANPKYNIHDQGSVKSDKSNKSNTSGSGSGSGSSSSSHSSKSSQSGDSTDNENEEPFFVHMTTQTKQPSKQKHAKVVPLSARKARKPKKEAFFQVSEDEDDNIREVNIPDSEEKGDSELETIVKQLVLLENEASKAQQFLEFIQKHNCFDKQDHKAVNQFLELIEEEKKSLIVVLSNYSPQMQPLITMMTIAERRLTLLDSTAFITPGSTLHASFLEKQQALQDVIEQASAHVYGK